eukprot:CAMPEP_0176004492 /NCGR_PEP_ID=MMETSP0120_2-20121206/1721_1 /TAXON_ID=160619 /ORGANISM="Kryptoperidinium foliaceum, Strain CCMP 1326" /LENGTH=116 /DNA_ID=CAMNT_0017337175 /DNA_START=59 /DNA_END=409 /DNA_ORIENTATION=-
MTVACVVAFSRSAESFSPQRPLQQRTTTTRLFDSEGLGTRLEQIEFKIYPDGRVEETVRGVKGDSCHSVTDKINEALGEVVESQPTEEMYEQKLVEDNTLTQSLGEGDSWEGKTSW